MSVPRVRRGRRIWSKSGPKSLTQLSIFQQICSSNGTVNPTAIATCSLINNGGLRPVRGSENPGQRARWGPGWARWVEWSCVVRIEWYFCVIIFVDLGFLFRRPIQLHDFRFLSVSYRPSTQPYHEFRC